jgi:hypothetical protein
LTKPFKFSSKAFLARILESDKAENLVSLLTVEGTTGLVTAGFGVSTTSLGEETVAVFASVTIGV